MQITGEGGHGGHADDDFVDFVIFPGSHDALDDRGANFVADGVLSINGCRDEELVLDVDKVLAVVDYLDVCVCNRVLCLSSAKYI